MNCQRCQQRPANVHITQYINGVKQETHLCEECAQALKMNLEFPQLPFHGLGNLLGFLTQAENIDHKVSEAKCPHCGTAYRKVAESGFVGCSECYRYFSEELEAILQKVHGTNQHRGKIPRRRGSAYQLKREIEDLKNSLKHAVEQEEYEEAARLRDKIRLLEDKSNSKAGGMND